MSEHKEDYKATFFIVPTHIIELPGMTLGYLKVYEAIFQFWNKGIPCFLGVPAICERTGLGESQVYDAITFFKSKNELARVKRDGKKYLVRPQQEVETDCDEIPVQRKIIPVQRKNNSGTAEHSNKNLNKEINIKEKSTKKEKTFLSLNDLLTDNPHDIPVQSISDWLAVRESKKAKVTKTAWTTLNTELAKYAEAGDDLTVVFNNMVSMGWASIKFEWRKEGSRKSGVKSEEQVKEDSEAEKYRLSLQEEHHHRKQAEIAAHKRASDSFGSPGVAPPAWEALTKSLGIR